MREDYLVLDMSFEAAEDCFASIYTMVQGIVNKVSRALSEYDVPDTLMEIWKYPFLVSYICKLLDERNYAWTREGFPEAVKILVKGPNTLYDDMIKQVAEYPELNMMLQNILFRGIEYPYHTYNKVINVGKMLGFIEDREGTATVSNRIFEMQLYSYFISEEFSKDHVPGEQILDKNQFILCRS